MKGRYYNYIDLFAGCGWLALWFYNSHKRKGIFAIEKDIMSFETLIHNLDKHFKRPIDLTKKAYDINQILDERKTWLRQFQWIELMAGGPPCQWFSLAWKRNPDDKRNKLVDSYLAFVKLINPKIVFLENVAGFTSQKKWEITYAEYVKTKLSSFWYKVESEILDFSTFWVPQRRKRFILVATLWLNGFFQKLENERIKFLEKKWLTENISIKNAISDLEKVHGIYPSKDTKGFDAGVYWEKQTVYQQFIRKWNESLSPDSHRFANHTPIIIKRFQYCIENRLLPKDIKEHFNLKKNNTQLLDENKPAPTLTTLPDDYIHYKEPRVLTVREYARIQSFPDWYEFKWKYTTWGSLRTKETPRYTQIGNAIPPLFAECVANVLYTMV